MDLLRIAGWTLGAYFGGGIPFGFLLGKLLLGVDIRERGSRNLGATNAARVLGGGRRTATIAWFLAVFLLDAGKGFAPAFLAEHFEKEIIGLPAGLFAGLGAIVGHMASPYLLFKGGKGVAVSAGALAAIVPVPLAVAAAVWGLVAATTRYVSLASIVATVTMPFVALAICHDPVLVAVLAMLAGAVVFRHRGNIARLVAGTENRLGGRRGGEEEREGEDPQDRGNEGSGGGGRGMDER